MREFIQKSRRSIRRALVSYRLLPERKQYVEFFTALLSIPVLITVIILNINNLRSQPAKSTEPQSQDKVIVVTGSSQNTVTSTQLTPVSCSQAFNQIAISYPQENDTISDNPLPIDISAPNADQCEVTWSYRVNGNNWSDYGNNSISLYNLPSGATQFDLRVKSTLTGQQKLLSRKFMYKNTSSVPTPTNTPTPTFTQNNQSSSSAH